MVAVATAIPCTGNGGKVLLVFSPTAATYNRLQRGIERSGQRTSARPALLKEVEGHALGGLGTDPWKCAQGVDELS